MLINLFFYVLNQFVGFGANVNAGGVWKHFGKYLHFWVLLMHNIFNSYLHPVNGYLLRCRFIYIIFFK